MRLNFVVIVGSVVALALWALFDFVLTPRERLTPGETSAIALVGLGIAAVLERMTRPAEVANRSHKTRKKVKR